MMEDIAMQLLELIMNSIKANAKNIEVIIKDLKKENTLILVCNDDGCGMNELMAKHAVDPFTTSRKTRKVGLGISFMKGLADLCNGTFSLNSKEGKGTKIEVLLQKDHIDLPKYGDFGEMIMFAIQANTNIDYLLEYQTNENDFVFDTKEIKKLLETNDLNNSETLLWIKDYINQEINKIKED